MGEPRAFGITEQLESLGFEAGRMKTGTTPYRRKKLRLFKMEEQKVMKILKSFHI
jgi:tRNA uridine 5-carboxymethylaminomethyl modification enzyme